MTKKRRRNDDDGERLSKKPATARPTGTVSVEFLENEDILGPVLATTPGLSFPANINFKPYVTKDPSSGLLLHSSDHPRLDYTAQEEKGGSSDSLLKDYVGVFDPATGKLQIVGVKRVTVRSTLRSEIEEMREEQAQAAAEKATLTARRHALAAEFGSKKSRKAIQDITENAIARGKAGDPNAGPKNEAVASAILENMTSTTSSMPTQKDLAASVDSSKPRPQPNLNAAFAADVYSIDTVVGSELMGLIAVKDWVDATNEGRGVELTSRYVAKRVTKFTRNKEITKLKVLKFINLCMNFYSALKMRGKGPKTVPSKDKLMALMGTGTPAPVVDAIRRRFASDNLSVPRWHNDNLMTHIAAAALIVDDFEVDTNDLREDLRLEKGEIKAYFQELGCRVVVPTEAERARLKITKAEGANHNIARLRLPLAFPKLPTGKKNSKTGR